MSIPKRKRAPGGGRKRLSPSGALTVTIQTTLPPEYVAAAERLGGGVLAVGLRIALEPHLVEPEQVTRRVELWRALDGGALYAVLVDGGICVIAAGPLTTLEAEAVRGGDTSALLWDAALGDKIAAAEDTGHAYARVCPVE